MDRTAKKLIEIARSQLGYHEKASNAYLDDNTANSGSGNWTKYARDLAAAGYYNGNKNGYAWCDVFVDWCFWTLCDHNRAEAEAMQCQTGDLGAGCLYSRQYYAAAGRLEKYPQPGDQVFFRNGGEVYHTGIVSYVNGYDFKTIEGNAGDRVAEHTYRFDPSHHDFGRPRFNLADEQIDSKNDEVETHEETHEETHASVYEYDVKLPLLERGCTGKAVESMQQLLIAKGFGCGEYGADGDFGDATRSAVENFQRANGLEVDGQCGGDTWRTLIRG